MAAEVFLCKHIKTDKLYAIKFLKQAATKKQNVERQFEFEREHQTLRRLDHEGIVKIYESGDNGVVIGVNRRVFKRNMSYIIMDHHPHEFFNYCVQNEAQGEDAGRFFLHQLVESVGYLHERGIAHRDLKMENLLLDDQLNLKLVDFGLSVTEDVSNLKQWCGTPAYACPQILEQKAYDGKQADIFSLGVIVWCIVTGRKPFDLARKDDYYYNLLRNKSYDEYFRAFGQENLSQEFKDLFVSMVSFEENNRPTCGDIKVHSWMNNSQAQFQAAETTDIGYQTKEPMRLLSGVSSGVSLGQSMDSSNESVF